jgi:hypothetical protein
LDIVHVIFECHAAREATRKKVEEKKEGEVAP